MSWCFWGPLRPCIYFGVSFFCIFLLGVNCFFAVSLLHQEFLSCSLVGLLYFLLSGLFPVLPSPWISSIALCFLDFSPPCFLLLGAQWSTQHLIWAEFSVELVLVCRDFDSQDLKNEHDGPAELVADIIGLPEAKEHADLWNLSILAHCQWGSQLILTCAHWQKCSISSQRWHLQVEECTCT